MADLDFCDYVVGGPTSTCLRSAGLIVYLAGGITVGVSFPADLGADVTVSVSPLADLAGDITVGVSSPSVCRPGRPCWRCHRWSGAFGRC